MAPACGPLPSHTKGSCNYRKESWEFWAEGLGVPESAQHLTSGFILLEPVQKRSSENTWIKIHMYIYAYIVYI